MSNKLKGYKLLRAAYKNALIVINNYGNGIYECVAVVNGKKVAKITEKRGVILRRVIA